MAYTQNTTIAGLNPILAANIDLANDLIPLWDSSAPEGSRTKYTTIEPLLARTVSLLNNVPWTAISKSGAVAADVGAVAIGDARLTDTRIPTDGSVTNAKVATNAAIAWSKIDKAGAVPGDVGAAATVHGHGDATTSVAGFMSAADKTKLNGIATGATANATDAQLRDRSTHTGEQLIGTVTGLQSALDARQLLNARLTALANAATPTSVKFPQIGTDGLLTLVDPPTGGGEGGSVVGGNIVQVATIAALKALTVPAANTLIYVRGYFADRDGGEGFFLYNSTSTLADNGGTYIAPTTGSGRYLRQMVDEIANVRHFGARGDGVTDDTNAFRRCVQWAIETASIRQTRKVRIPRGQYVTVGGNIFAPAANNFNSKWGMHFEGDGWGTDILMKPAGTTTIYLHDDDEANTPDYYFAIVSGIRFVGDSTKQSQCMGFKWNPMNGGTSGLATGSDKWVIRYCDFDYFNELFRANGAVLSGEMRFEHLKINRTTAAFIWNNQQAVNWNLYGVDIVANTYFKVESNAGGSLGVYGGSWSTSGGTATILQVDNTNKIGATHFFNFHNVRVEIINLNDKLVEVNNGSNSTIGFVNINWNNCAFLKTYGAVGDTVNWVRLGRQCSLVFRDSSLDPGLTYTFTSNAAIAAGAHNYGILGFESCWIPRELADQILFTAAGLGRAYAHNCRGHKGSQTASDNAAIDFDLGWSGGGSNEMGFHLKRSSIFNTTVLSFPENGSGERFIRMPRGAQIKNIYVLKPAGIGNTNTYQLFVGNATKSVIYGQSTSAAANQKHYIAVERAMDNLIDTGAANAEQVRLWATGGAAANMFGATCYAIVEYF